MAPATEIITRARNIADRHGLDETLVCAVRHAGKTLVKIGTAANPDTTAASGATNVPAQFTSRSAVWRGGLLRAHDRARREGKRGLFHSRRGTVHASHACVALQPGDHCKVAGR
jgi:hypothetical protein